MNNTNGNTGIVQLLLSPIPTMVSGGADYVGGADSVSASNIANTDQYRNYYGAYFQDDFKVNSRFTLTLAFAGSTLASSSNALGHGRISFRPGTAAARSFC